MPRLPHQYSLRRLWDDADFLMLRRHGRRPSTAMKAWTQAHLMWVKPVHFAHAAHEATLLDYLHEVEHAAERIARLEHAIDEAVKTAPESMRAVIAALQALRGIALVSAATIVSEVGECSRFAKPRQLMGYSGAVSSEDSSGKRIRRGAITKTGNAHLRRVVIEAAWAYRYRPAVGAALRKHQASVSPEVTAIAWKAQHRLHARDRHLLARGTCTQEVVTAVGRELLGFIWAIGVQVEANGRAGQSAAASQSGPPCRESHAATMVVERHTEWRILDPAMRRAFGLDPRHESEAAPDGSR